MGAVTYPDSAVINFIHANLIPLKVPFDSQPLAKDFNVKWTPTLVTLGEDGREHHRTVGFLDPAELIANLLLGMGKYHFDHDRFSEAVARFNAMVAEYPASDSVPEALYLRGVSRYKEEQNPVYLKEAYLQLKKDFPGNEWTKRASPYRLIE
jgi:hypothetical protein